MNFSKSDFYFGVTQHATLWRPLRSTAGLSAPHLFIAWEKKLGRFIAPDFSAPLHRTAT
jgi:hypothetical protein